MCRYIRPTGWACVCQLRPGHTTERPFLKRCGASMNPGEDQRCRGPHSLYTEANIPWLCHLCHDEVIQNHLRPLYGLTGSTVSSVLRELDRTDPHRDLLAGADLRVRNQLDANLQRLEANIIATTRKFNECRDETLEAFYGTDVYCHMKLDLIADQGQKYCFIPHNQPAAPSMLTSLELRDKELPMYERDLVPNPYQVLPIGASNRVDDGLPGYSDICPYNSLNEFQPVDDDCNDDAVSEGASSESSDCLGEGMTRIEILGRLRRKLRDEFHELSEIDDPSDTSPESTSRPHNPALTFSPAQQARYGTLGFASVQDRRARRQQLRKQLQTLNIILSEEIHIVKAYKDLVMLRTAVMNGEASKTSRLAETRQALQRAVQKILQNRVNHSLSELLLPLNGTDPSKCHAVHLLPDSHRSMFATRAFGFPHPMAKDQFDSYTAAPGQPWSDGGDEDPEQNGDVDQNGNVTIAHFITGPDTITLDTPMSDAPLVIDTKDNIQENPGAQRRDYVPVTHLKRYHVEDDEYTPKVRVVRIPRQGLAFELVMPTDTPRHLKPNLPSEPDLIQNIASQQLSLVALVGAFRTSSEVARSSYLANLEPILTTSTQWTQARLTLDMTSVERDLEVSHIIRDVQTRPHEASPEELAGMSVLEELVAVAIGLDGQIVRPTDPRLERIRTILSPSRGLPRRFQLPPTEDDFTTLAMRDDPLLDARARRSERHHDRLRRADEQEEGRRLLQSMRANQDERQPSSNGGVEIDDDDDASEDELDAPSVRRR